MTSIKLNSGYEMPLVGLGTWQSAPGEVGQAVKVAIEAGYRHLDCAYIYGNEKEIGAALAEVFREGKIKREDLFIVTKLWSTKHHPEDVKPSLQESLDNLGLQYVDLYLIHYPVSFKRGADLMPKDEAGNPLYDDVHYLKTWKAMEECVDQGLIRSIGLSNFNSIQIQDVIDNCRIPPAVLQVELHPYFQQLKLVDFCRRRNIAVTSYSSFCSPGWSGHTTAVQPILENECLVAICKKYSKTPAQVILRWLYQERIISIPKSVSATRIRQNIAIFDFELTADDIENIKKLDKNLRMMTFFVERDGKREMRDKDAPYFPFNVEF